jgi:hypothetical protein
VGIEPTTFRVITPDALPLSYERMNPAVKPTRALAGGNGVNGRSNAFPESAPDLSKRQAPNVEKAHPHRKVRVGRNARKSGRELGWFGAYLVGAIP